jgi:hypothetical protein
VLSDLLADEGGIWKLTAMADGQCETGNQAAPTRSRDSADLTMLKLLWQSRFA